MIVSPIIAVAIGVVYAHEPFGWAEAVGGVVMLTATALTLTEKAEVRTAPNPVP